VPDEVAQRYEIEDRDVAGYPVQILHPRQGGSVSRSCTSTAAATRRRFCRRPGQSLLVSPTALARTCGNYALSPDATVDDAPT
jgi:epsilon-lactone hydrolase